MRDYIRIKFLVTIFEGGKWGYANPSIRQNFCSNPKPQPDPKTEVQRFKSKLVHVNATVNFAQIVKKVTLLMTITQYNSNNSLTPAFK